jgi:hypothetical protein
MLSINHESFMIYYQMIILYSICYVQIQLHRVSNFVVLMYICYLTDICIPIQSHQSGQARSTTWRTSNGCNYSSVYSML